MATPEQIMTALRKAHDAGDAEGAKRLAQMYQESSQQPEQPSFSVNPTDGMSTTDLLLAGTGAGLTSVARGAGQRLRDVLPQEWSDKLSLPTEKDVEEARKLEKPLMDTAAGKIGNFVGEIVPGLLLPGGGLLKTMASGAGLGALQQTGEGESALKNAAIGAAGGALGYGAVAGAGRLLRPVRSELSDSGKALAQKAKDMGIDLDAAQLSGSKPLRIINSVLNDLPLSSGAQQAKNELQHKQFNSAIAKTMGSNADLLNEAAMAEIKSRVGGGIGDIADRNRFTFDNDMLTKLTQHSFDAQRFETGDVQKIVNNYIDDFMSKVEPNGTVSGQAYRKLDSALGARARGTTNGDLRQALGNLRETLREGMDKSISPQDAAEWSKLRGQYRNMKLIEPLAAKSVDGNISPNALLNAANKGSKNAAYQSNDLKDLGKIGKEFLQEFPSSGTAQRNFYTEALTNPLGIGAAGFLAGGPVGALAGLLGPVATQKLINSNAGKKYLTEGMLKSLQGLEQPAQRYLASPVGSGLLINMSQQ
ncbi:hypothetical protein V2P20_09005 [Methylobacter sp. Wu1]|uniref:hypothetical protein n=1 Tax=Methylobacter sp. Wu1 TaxID=3119359 RepID=UPI002F929473